MSAKIAVGRYASMGGGGDHGDSNDSVCTQTSSPAQPSFSGTSELGYAFVVPKEITIFCSLRILSQLLLLECQVGLNL